MRRVGRFGALVAAVLVLVCVGDAIAARKTRDQTWTRPDFDRLGVDRIALIPVISYDNNIQNENQVEATLGPAFKSTGYRWVSGTSAREMLRARAGGDSLLKALRLGILASARLDSLEAPRIARMLGCDAMLTIRVDQFEHYEPEWNVAGKPFTRVQLHAALVDSAGRLLWSANATETGEGTYNDPSTSPVAVKDSGLDRKPVSGQGGAPSFREVLSVIFTRWSGLFPPHAVPAPSPAADSAATVH